MKRFAVWMLLVSGVCLGAAKAADPGAVARTVLAEGDYQTTLPQPAPAPAPPPAPTPDPGQADVDVPDFSLTAPEAKWFAAIALAVIVTVVVFLLWRHGGRWPQPARRAGLYVPPQAVHPDTDKILEEAERQAAAGAFAAAVRLLLHGSLDHLQARRLLRIGQDSTAREALGGFSGNQAARAALARLVGAEEFCLFAGGTPGAQTYTDCRDAYLQLVGGDGR